MTRNGRSKWLVAGLAAAVAACTSSQPGSTTTASPPTPVTPPPTTTTVSGGEVVLADSGAGMWIDSVGGTWMDTTGAIWMHGRRGMRMGLQPSDVSGMNNQNIVAHLGAGDSLEVALSTAGAAAARDTAVRAFAQRMVTEHTAHMQMAMQSATEGGITPTPAPADTADAAVAMHVMSHLTSAMPGADYDKRLMRAQVMMHQHMLHDLTMLRPQASGTAQQLIDQTIPVVQQHLSDAKALLRMVDSTTGS